MAGAELRTDCVYGMDLELTCWDGPTPEGEAREIISIGMAELRLADGQLSRRETWLVRPPRLTPDRSVSAFCTALTGLDAATLQSRGRPLREVLSTLRKAWAPARRLTVCWGDDVPRLAEHAARHSGESPFGPNLDLAQLLHVLHGGTRRRSLEAALAAHGIHPEQPAHDAGVDAANTLRLFAVALPRGAPRPPDPFPPSERP